MGVNLLEEEAATRLTRALFPRVFVSVVARSAVCVRVWSRCGGDLQMQPLRAGLVSPVVLPGLPCRRRCTPPPAGVAGRSLTPGGVAVETGGEGAYAADAVVYMSSLVVG